MNGCTINIAEFRCRPTGRSASPSNRLARRTHAFEVVLPATVTADHDAEMLQEAILQEDPTVYDIGVAREAQRMRSRIVFRPISIQRKAKVLRFNEQVPVQVKMRVEEGRGGFRSGVSEGPYDFPPAA